MRYATEEREHARRAEQPTATPPERSSDSLQDFASGIGNEAFSNMLGRSAYEDAGAPAGATSYSATDLYDDASVVPAQTTGIPGSEPDVDPTNLGGEAGQFDTQPFDLDNPAGMPDQ